MKATKKTHLAAHTSSQKSQQDAAKHRLAIHSNLSPLLTELQRFNAPADQVLANWMARGHIQRLEVIPPKMTLHVRPLKPIPEGLYQYWTTIPLLQIQLFSAYLCDCVVDIFSITPESLPCGSIRDGGEILTINVNQDRQSSKSLKITPNPFTDEGKY